jgi:hypothetical protein
MCCAFLLSSELLRLCQAGQEQPEDGAGWTSMQLEFDAIDDYV